MKRTICLLLVCIALIGTFCGCQSEAKFKQTKALAMKIPEPIAHIKKVEPEPEPTTIDLTFAGDCMLATYKGQVKAGSFSTKALEGDWDWFLSGVKSIFEADDFTVVNLENVLSDKKLSPVKKNHDPAYWYIAPTENTNILTAGSVEIANLANNHTGDYGKTGAADTIAAVESAGLLYGNNDRTVYVEKDGFKIAFIFHGLWSEWQTSQIIPRIEEASKQSDFQVVYYHGGKERIHTPETWKVRASHKLVDAGADLVIGNHPHVLQPMEEYNGVPIIYSMGNFCYGGSSTCENRTIIYKYRLTLGEDNAVVEKGGEVIPCYVYGAKRNNYRPEVITDETEKAAVLDFMAGNRRSPV